MTLMPVLDGLGGVVKGVAGAFTARQNRKAVEKQAVAQLEAQVSTNQAQVTISREQAEALAKKAATDGLQRSLKDEVITITVALFFFIWPAVAGVIDALAGTNLVVSHLSVLNVLTHLTTDTAVGLVFVGVCLAAVGITGIRSFFR